MAHFFPQKQGIRKTNRLRIEILISIAHYIYLVKVRKGIF